MAPPGVLTHVPEDITVTVTVAVDDPVPGVDHVAPWGLAACQRGLGVRYTSAAALMHELVESSDGPSRPPCGVGPRPILNPALARAG